MSLPDISYCFLKVFQMLVRSWLTTRYRLHKTPIDSVLHLPPTMTSADFCALSTALGSGYLFQGILHRPPRVPHISFSPSICHISCVWFRVVIGLRLVRQSYPHVQPSMWFLFVRPEICPWVSRFPTSSFLQIPLRSGHPCLRLYPSHYRADSGLAPVRNVRRRAHPKKSSNDFHQSLLLFLTSRAGIEPTSNA